MTMQKREEFVAIYKKYAQPVYRYCFFRVGSKDLAEELMQEAFIKTWQYIVGGKKIENIRSFLYQVSRNLIIDYYRQREAKYKKTLSLETIGVETMKNGLAYEKKDDYEKTDLLREVFSVIGRLPKMYQDLLIMKYVQDLRPKEIANILKASNKNVSAKLKRAEKKLNWILENSEFGKKVEA
ncbi:MAG: RNA polymerase sigma factor [Candidatus Portnoybacteria bacterium]|nr:RNA polymerase sigma factor [Candidatus Portnoybacteria bacterium]